MQLARQGKNVETQAETQNTLGSMVGFVGSMREDLNNNDLTTFGDCFTLIGIKNARRYDYDAADRRVVRACENRSRGREGVRRRRRWISAALCRAAVPFADKSSARSATLRFQI